MKTRDDTLLPGEKADDTGRLPTWGVVLFGIVVVVGANRAGVWLAGPGVQPVGNEPGREAEPPVILRPDTTNFGEVQETDAFRWHAIAENVSRKPALLQTVDGICDCTRVDFKGGELGPGERVKIPMTIDLQEIRWFDPADVRSVTVDLSARTEQDGRTAVSRWAVKGKVRRHLACDPVVVRLPDPVILRCSSRPMECRIRALTRIDRLLLKEVPEGWTAELTEVDHQRQQHVLHFTVKNKSVGPFANSIQLQGVHRDRGLPPHRVRVEGRTVGIIETIPQPVNLGTVSVKAKSEGRCWMRPLTEDTIEHLDVERGGAGINFVRIQRKGLVWQVDIEAAIDEPGWGERECIVQARLKSGTMETCAVRVQWYGSSPQSEHRGRD